MERKTFAIDIDGTITENGGGRIHLGALAALRRLTHAGHNVIYVTGRSSVEGFILSVFGGTTGISVGENGGCITTDSDKHILLGDIKECQKAFSIISQKINNVTLKKVYPRMTEIVLERTFDIAKAKQILADAGIFVTLSDSQYAYHINSYGINKGVGFTKVMQMLSVDRKDVIAIGDSDTDISLFKVAGTSIALGNASDGVKSCATITTSAGAGDGVLEALDKLELNVICGVDNT